MRLFSAVLGAALGWILAGEAAAQAQETRLANLAIRAEAAAEAPLIVGFNVGGGAEKTVLIRAVGPTLEQFGVSAPLADPRLELFAAGGRRIGANDDHAATDAPVFSAVGAFALAAGSKDAAIVARLGSGSYTAHVTGPVGARGTALVEVYEVGAAGTPLTNLSARARVGSGEAILIPGLVLSPGATSRRLLVRAVGPGLEPFGVTGLLADPKLDLFQGGARIAGNDNWGAPSGPSAATAEGLRVAFQQSGAFALPTGSLDAALITRLPPGGYTLQVSGVAGRTGEALVEVYDLTDVAPGPFPEAAREASAALRAQIDALVAPEIDPTGAGGKIVGAAVGIIGPDVRTVLGYGVSALGSTVVPGGDTLFEIGSNTKPMTGLILADGVVKGRMRLDDPVSRLLPNAVLPTSPGAPLQLVHLATHTGGLANFPDNLVGAQPNPAAGYTRALLFDYLGRAPLRTRPGAAMAYTGGRTLYQSGYSNLGFGLLGVALQDAAKSASYDALFVEYLGDPLGMKDTRVNVPASSAARLARGSRQGRAVVPSQIDTLEASGALRSTGTDMLAFIAANLAPPATLADAVALSQTVQFDLGGRKMALGFSVETRNGRTYFSKSGGTPGFTSHVRFTTNPSAGVVVLTNIGQTDAAERLAETVLEAMLDNSSDNDTDQSNGPDFDSSTNTVLLTQTAYNYPNGVETEVEYTERVAVVPLPGSSHKVYEANGLFYIIQLDENNNVVYTEGDRNSFFMGYHNEMPRLVTSNIQSDVTLNMQVYYSNAPNAQTPEAPAEIYEFIWDYGDQGKIEGKEFIGAKFDGRDKYGTPWDINPYKFGDTFRATFAIVNIPDKNITTAPLTELVYKEVGVVNYKGVKWRYEADLYEGEADFLSHIKPNFDRSLEDLSNTDGANNLNTISVFGGRTYTCGAEANCIGNEGYIYCFTKTPDLYMFTHEIGHTWSLREDSPVNWVEWEELWANYFVSEYAKRNPEEYFADAFYYYFSGQKDLEDFPNLYQMPDEVRAKLDTYFK